MARYCGHIGLFAFLVQDDLSHYYDILCSSAIKDITCQVNQSGDLDNRKGLRNTDSWIMSLKNTAVIVSNSLGCKLIHEFHHKGFDENDEHMVCSGHGQLGKLQFNKS